jgi:hypothetical protein
MVDDNGLTFAKEGETQFTKRSSDMLQAKKGRREECSSHLCTH